MNNFSPLNYFKKLKSAAGALPKRKKMKVSVGKYEKNVRKQKGEKKVLLHISSIVIKQNLSHLKSDYLQKGTYL